MRALENMADYFTKFIVWIRCFFTGHEPAPVQIVPTEIQFRTDPAVAIDIIKFKISSPLYYCRKCGRLRFGP